MGFTEKSSIAVAAVVVGVTVGASVVATPVAAPQRTIPVYSTAAVDLVASSTELQPPRTADAQQALASVADQIDDAFIDITVLIRRGVTPALNGLGYLGKQLYIGLNLIESVTASAVFNGTDVLRGEKLLRNVGEFALDVGVSGLYVLYDELFLAGKGDAFVLDRPPLDHPVRWTSADEPRKGFPLTVPERDPIELDVTAADPDSVDSVDTLPQRDGAITRWKAKQADLTEKRAEKRAERREAREERREAREERREARKARSADSASAD